MGENVPEKLRYVKVYLQNDTKQYEIGEHVRDLGDSKETGKVINVDAGPEGNILIDGTMKIFRYPSNKSNEVWNNIKIGNRLDYCNFKGTQITPETGEGLLQGRVTDVNNKPRFIIVTGRIRLQSSNVLKYNENINYTLARGLVVGKVFQRNPRRYVIIERTQLRILSRDVTKYNPGERLWKKIDANIIAIEPNTLTPPSGIITVRFTAPAYPTTQVTHTKCTESNIQYIRWGTPKIKNTLNTKSFDRTALVTNPGYKLPPKAEQFTEEQINKEKHKICDFITQLINNHMLNYLEECNPRAKFCSIPIPFTAQSIVGNTLHIDSQEVSDMIITPTKKDNPVTLVAIFCSMVKIMNEFLQSGKSHLLWIQEKGNIVDREQFNQLVDDCAMRFDVVWLWAPFQRQNGPRVQSFGNVETQQFLHHGVGTQQNTSLNYTTMEQCQHVSCPTLGNVAVMLNQDVVKLFLLYLTQPAQFYRTNNPKDLLTPSVNIFKEDVTLETFVKTHVQTNRVAIVFEQETHPIEYIQATSSYKDSPL